MSDESLINADVQPDATATEVAPETESTDQTVTTAPEDEKQLLAGKYSDVAGLEKGYKELTAKMREKHPTAPEGGYSIPELDKEGLPEHLADYAIPEDDLGWKTMAPVFEKHNLSQEAVNDIANVFTSMQIKDLPDPGNELKSLGPDKDQIIGSVSLGLKNALSEDEFTVVQEMGVDPRTAEGITILKKLISYTSEKNVPASIGNVAPRRNSDELIAEAQALSAEPGFENDPVKMRLYDQKMQQAFS